MVEIVKLETERGVYKQQVVDMLEDMLEQAKAGEIIAAGIFYVRPGTYAIGGKFTATDLAGPLLGSAHIMTHRLTLAIERDNA